MIDEQLDANFEALLRETLAEMIPKALTAELADTDAGSLEPDAVDRRRSEVVALHTAPSSNLASRARVGTVGAVALVAAAVVAIIVVQPRTAPAPIDSDRLTSTETGASPAPTAATVTDSAVDATALPAAYSDVLALFPPNDWIALAVRPRSSAFAYDRSGRSFGFSYVESTAEAGLPDTADAPSVSLPDGLDLYLSNDGGVITTPAGDGALLSCQQTRMSVSLADPGSCFAPDGHPPIGPDQIARTAAELLPLLREAPSGNLAELDNFWPLSVDHATATRTLENALGTSTASVSVDAGVLGELTPGEPLVVELADGSKVLSMLAPYGVLFRVHVDASLSSDAAIAGVRLLNDLVTLGGPSAMTTVPPQPVDE